MIRRPRVVRGDRRPKRLQPDIRGLVPQQHTGQQRDHTCQAAGDHPGDPPPVRPDRTHQGRHRWPQADQAQRRTGNCNAWRQPPLPSGCPRRKHAHDRNVTRPAPRADNRPSRDRLRDAARQAGRDHANGNAHQARRNDSPGPRVAVRLRLHRVKPGGGPETLVTHTFAERPHI